MALSDAEAAALTVFKAKIQGGEGILVLGDPGAGDPEGFQTFSRLCAGKLLISFMICSGRRVLPPSVASWRQPLPGSLGGLCCVECPVSMATSIRTGKKGRQEENPVPVHTLVDWKKLSGAVLRGHRLACRGPVIPASLGRRIFRLTPQHSKPPLLIRSLEHGLCARQSLKLPEFNPAARLLLNEAQELYGDVCNIPLQTSRSSNSRQVGGR